MFDIGWTEMLVIAVVMIVVVGPKDLPKMLRTFGRTTTKLRSMAGDFQRQFNDALKEAELDDVKKSVDALRSLNPTNEIRKQLNPFEKAAADVRAGLDSLKPQPKPEAIAETHVAEPLKNGADVLANVTAPAQNPPPPIFPVMTETAPSAASAEAQPAMPLKGSAASAAKAPRKAQAKSAAPRKTATKTPAPATASKPRASRARTKDIPS